MLFKSYFTCLNANSLHTHKGAYDKNETKLKCTHSNPSAFQYE